MLSLAAIAPYSWSSWTARFLEQLDGPPGELDVLAVCLAERRDVRGDLHPVDHEVPRVTTDRLRGIEHLVNEHRHGCRRTLDHHSGLGGEDLDSS